MNRLVATRARDGTIRRVAASFSLATVAVVALSVSSPAAAQLERTGPIRSGVLPDAGEAGWAPHLRVGSTQAVCSSASLGKAQCLSDVFHPNGIAPAASSPTGLSPGVIEGVYGFTSASSAGAGQTIAIVDAYNDPYAAGDLAAFSTQYGLLPECTSGATPPSCFEFTQVNQSGQSSLPANNSSWSLEMSLDIEWAHALAPAASILLVEAADANDSDLLAAEQYAAANANYVSNSWGAAEFSSESYLDSYFSTPGVSYFVAAGDSGGVVEWPSSSPQVISVGGTTLRFGSGGKLAQESAWSSGGGGCSSYEAANTYQLTASVNCAGERATPDLSLDADPSSGVSVYDSYVLNGQSGWWTVGGTSASTPMVAAEAAVAGIELNAKYLYANPPNLEVRDVTAGSNGHPALTGFDLATGLGSWSLTPGAPTGLSASSGSGGVTLAWNAPSGAPANSYDIWRGSVSGGETTELGAVTAPTTSFLDTSSSLGSTYYYEITAVNGLGTGPASNEVSVTAGNFHTVDFDPNGGVGTMAAQSSDTAAPLRLNSFSRAGYSFYAWNTAPDGSGASYANGATYAFSASRTLYAQWTAVSSGPPASPGVVAISPSSGPTAGGTPVTITGTSFATASGATTVKFGPVPAKAVSCSSTTRCVAVSPPEASGTVDVTVSTAGVVSTTSPADRFVFLPVPDISGLSPGFGPQNGGTKVTIYGSGFVGKISVYFGANQATNLRVLSSSELTLTSPKGSGAIYVVATSSGGSSKKVPASRFSYVGPPTVSKVTASIGLGSQSSNAVIRGSNFVGTVTVYFGGHEAAWFLVVSPTEIIATAPAKKGAVYVIVRAAGGSSKKTRKSLVSFEPFGLLPPHRR